MAIMSSRGLDKNPPGISQGGYVSELEGELPRPTASGAFSRPIHRSLISHRLTDANEVQRLGIGRRKGYQFRQARMA
jgi:hypothetical protein